MELSEKLQELRKQRGLTQEALADALFVSRTAVSKWESGRGYPSIDSLKAIAEYFCITIDDLLSGKELLSIAQKDSASKVQHLQDLFFGLLDCFAVLPVFVPLFGQPDGDFIRQVSLLSLETTPYIKLSYLVSILITVVWGIALLALQNCSKPVWVKLKLRVSVLLGIFIVLAFIATQEPYAAAFALMLLIGKGILLSKRL